jgi:hypothetical protein
VFGFNSFAKNAFSYIAVGGAIVFASAQVSANAEVISSSSVTKPFSGSILSTATFVSDAIRQRTSLANVSGTATFDLSDYLRIRGNSADISAYALFGAEGYSLAVASGTMFSNSSVSADAFRIVSFVGHVDVTASVYALGGYELRSEAISYVNATATVTSLANATWSANANITPNGTVIVNGTVLGEEWSDSAVGSETWSTVSTGNEVWVEDTPESNTWLRQG